MPVTKYYISFKDNDVTQLLLVDPLEGVQNINNQVPRVKTVKNQKLKIYLNLYFYTLNIPILVLKAKDFQWCNFIFVANSFDLFNYIDRICKLYNTPYKTKYIKYSLKDFTGDFFP